MANDDQVIVPLTIHKGPGQSGSEGLLCTISGPAVGGKRRIASFDHFVVVGFHPDGAEIGLQCSPTEVVRAYGMIRDQIQAALPLLPKADLAKMLAALELLVQNEDTEE